MPHVWDCDSEAEPDSGIAPNTPHDTYGGVFLLMQLRLHATCIHLAWLGYSARAHDARAHDACARRKTES